MKLTTCYDYVLVEDIPDEKNEGIICVETEPSFFAKGKVVDSGSDEYYNGKTVLYIRRNANRVGLGFPSNLFIVDMEDIVAFIEGK